MFHFTIRDVLWLMVVVTLAVAWWIDRSALSKQMRRLKADFHFSRAIDGID